MSWSLSSAITAYRIGGIQDWIESYLQVPEWQNLGLLRRVREYSVKWLEPQLFDISCLSRVAGPGEHYRFPKDPDEWRAEVDAITATPAKLEDFPPIIAWREDDGALNVADGNHRLDALTALGFGQCWVLLHDGPLRSSDEIEARRRRT